MNIVCFGDSLTSCGGENGRFSDILQDRFPEHEFVNKGVGGETFVEALDRLTEDVLDPRPDVVLIEFGANDWWQAERPPTSWQVDLDTCVQRIQSIGAEAVILGVFGPVRDPDGKLVPKEGGIDERGASYQRLEAETARKRSCRYVPNMQEHIVDDRCCWLDQNHPNEYGNRYVADMIEPLLEEMLGSKALPIRKPTLALIQDLWSEAVALAPDRLAAVDGDRRLTFADADSIVEQLAAGICGATTSPGPKVAVSLPNCLEYFLLYWAVARLGGAIVPLNTWLKRDSLEAIFTNVRPDLLVVDGRSDRDVIHGAKQLPNMPVFALSEADSDDATLLRYEDLLGDAELPPLPPPCPEDAAIIMHTSGTTAAPKGAVMRHSDLMFNVMTTVNAHQFGPSDVHLLVNPMFHCTALYSSLTTAAYQKAPVVITADTTPDRLLALVQAERISTWLTVPSILQRVVGLANLHDYELSTLRLIGYAGSQMPVSTIKQLRRHFPGVELHNFFGLTETISMTHVLSGEDAIERSDSIGKLLPFVRARITDEHGDEAPPDAVGELYFARECIISGYYNQPRKLDESVVEHGGKSWFNTGDLAAVDSEGYFFVKGRKKDMIIVGGENVYSLEVEGVLMNHDRVKEAAVKAVPATGIRESLGELIKAYVVPTDEPLTEMDIRKHCHARLPSYKIPHLIVFLDELPRNPAGKVVKERLD